MSHKRPLEDEDDEGGGEFDGKFSRESEMTRSLRAPPLSPPVPGRRPTQRNPDRPIADAFAPLSPKSPPMLDPQVPSFSFTPFGISKGSPPPAAPRTEASPAGDNPPWSQDTSRDEGSSKTDLPSMSCTPELQGPLRPPLTPAEAIQWGTSLECSPPPQDRKAHPSCPPSCSNGTSLIDRGGTPSPTCMFFLIKMNTIRKYMQFHAHEEIRFNISINKNIN